MFSLETQLDLFFGEANPATCRVYARIGLDSDETQDGLQLAGTLRGPHCELAQTLPATFPLVDLGPGKSLLAQAILPDPCFWTPELPFLYQARVELRRGAALLATAERLFGIRPLGVTQKQFRWEGKPWVLRGVSGREMAPEELPAWHETGTALVVENPPNELCEFASRQGLLMVAIVHQPAESILAELRRLSRWPAVGFAILNRPDLHDAPLRQAAPNLILGQQFEPGQSIAPAGWAQIALGDVGNLDDLAAFFEMASRYPLPVVARRKIPVDLSFLQARAECDRLQRDLAGSGEFAGYVAAPQL